MGIKLNQSAIEEREERVLPGILGSLLFSLAGGIVWFILWQIDIVAGLSGIVGVFCAMKGYEIFAKKNSVKGVVISFVFALAIIVLTWYLCIGYDYYSIFVQDAGIGGESLFVCLFNGFEILDFYDYIGATEIRGEYMSNLIFGIVFTVIGGIGYVVDAVRKAKAEVAAPAPAQPVLNGEEDSSDLSE